MSQNHFFYKLALYLVGFVLYFSHVLKSARKKGKGTPCRYEREMSGKYVRLECVRVCLNWYIFLKPRIGLHSYLSVPLHPPLRRVLRQEVEPEAGQDLRGVAVLPDQLQLPDAHLRRSQGVEKAIISILKKTLKITNMPNQQRTLNKLPTELRRKVFVTKHRLSIQIGGKRAKNEYAMCTNSDWDSILPTTVGGWAWRENKRSLKHPSQDSKYVKSKRVKNWSRKKIKNLKMTNNVKQTCFIISFFLIKKRLSTQPTHQVVVWPYLDEEELPEAEDPVAAVRVELDGLVEGVGGVVAAARTNNLGGGTEKKNVWCLSIPILKKRDLQQLEQLLHYFFYKKNIACYNGWPANFCTPYKMGPGT